MLNNIIDDTSRRSCVECVRTLSISLNESTTAEGFIETHTNCCRCQKHLLRVHEVVTRVAPSAR